ALGRNVRADHENDRPVEREPETGALALTGMEAAKIDAVGNERRGPSRPVSLEIIGIGANEAVTFEAAIFGAVRIGRPVAVLRHEETKRPLARDAPERPVGEGERA